MKKPDFERTPLREQVYLVLESGKPITAREFLHYYISLYAYSDFYVELWYIPATNKIEKVEALGIDDVLQIYKTKFDISGLLK
ncbi:MAG: hypothetical protein RG741_05040 [Bacteroidales bacterium]|nr:hypothetical protein [Bacteroidales bacterium]